MTFTQRPGPERHGGRSPSNDHLRLLTKVARLYHEHGARQPEIASRLHISQPRVSRLLKQAVELGIVRTVVLPPSGVHTDVEERVERGYGLREVTVVETDGETDEAVLPTLGAAAAVYLETTLTGGDRIGISSWSSTLLNMVDSMTPRSTQVAEEVVQILGGVGHPTAQARATRLVGRLAELTGAEPVYLQAPGLVGSAAACTALTEDAYVGEVMAAWERLTMLLVGVGSLEPSPLLRASGNAIAQEDEERLRALGAVGDVCLRFFDANGEEVRSGLEERVLGIPSRLLRGDVRCVAVAGGERKYSAIRAALLGGWVDVLITDLGVASRLAVEADTTGS